MRLPVLTYHAVLPLEEDVQLRGTVPLSVFERQVEWLARSGHETLTLDQAADQLEGRGEPVRRGVVLTFDDGYRSVVEHAVPVLERFGFNATLFVVTDAVGQITDWYVPKGGRPFEHASWDELEQVRARGFDVGSHTVHHPWLGRLDADSVQAELCRSKDEIEKRLGRCQHLAYPHGDASPEITKAVRKVGYRTACTTRRGFNRPGQPLLALRRQNVSRTTGARRFRRKVGSWW
jgi:peptidoglycan/xylan/chitin deacetylase (PgdA/CDA1 family)